MARRTPMVEVAKPKTGDRLVNLDEKLYPDHKAPDGARALVMMHTVPCEAWAGLVHILCPSGINRKGFKTTLALYGPGVAMAPAGRGFPDVGEEGFPGNLAINRQIETMIKEGVTIHACRFA